MRAGIMCVPKRVRLYSQLRKQLEADGIDVSLYVDHKREGGWNNFLRMMTEELDTAKPGELVFAFEDDVYTVPGWLDYFMAIHERAQGEIYVLYSRRPELATPENFERRYVTGVLPRAYYTTACAYIDQHGLMDRMMSWLNSGGAETFVPRSRLRHWDIVLQEYLIAHDIPWTVLTPCLFQHNHEVPSTLGHSWSSGSQYFIGDVKSGK